MNEKDNFSIKIKKEIMCRSVREKCKSSLASSELCRGLYCVSRLKDQKSDSTLCVLLDDKESYLTDRILNRDLNVSLEKLCQVVCQFASFENSTIVILATKFDNKGDFLLIASKAYVISDRLKEHGITLEGYYITTEADFENVLLPGSEDNQ